MCVVPHSALLHYSPALPSSSALLFSLHVAEASTFPADDCAVRPHPLWLILFASSLRRAAPRSARLLARPFVRSLVSSFFGVCLAVQFLFLFFSCCCPSPLAIRLLYMSFGSLPLAAQFLFLCCYFNTHVYNKNTKAETRQVKLRWAQQPHSGHACIKKSAISSAYKYIIFISFCVFIQHICSTHASYGRGIFSIINFCIFNHCHACLSCSISPSYDVCMYKNTYTYVHVCMLCVFFEHMWVYFSACRM